MIIQVHLDHLGQGLYIVIPDTCYAFPISPILSFHPDLCHHLLFLLISPHSDLSHCSMNLRLVHFKLYASQCWG